MQGQELDPCVSLPAQDNVGFYDSNVAQQINSRECQNLCAGCSSSTVSGSNIWDSQQAGSELTVMPQVLQVVLVAPWCSQCWTWCRAAHTQQHGAPNTSSASCSWITTSGSQGRLGANGSHGRLLEMSLCLQFWWQIQLQVNTAIPV